MDADAEKQLKLDKQKEKDQKKTPEARRNIEYEHDPDHPPTSYLETIVHLFKGNIGPGLFAMGDAFKNGGIIVAPILTILIAIVCVHCQHVLVACSKKMRNLRGDPVCSDYAETVEQCFENGPMKLRSYSKTMKTVVNIFICVTQLGFCCIYFVFIGTNMKQIFHAYGYDINVHIVIATAFIPVVFTCMITNLKWLTPVSLFANVCMILGLAITLYYALKDGLPDITERHAYTDGSKLALYFGTAIFAFEGIALVLPLKNAMRNPDKFENTFGVLNVGMVLVSIMFMFAGSVGYLKWGEHVGGSLTLNLGDSVLAQAVKIMVSTGVLLGYPLQFFIAIQIMWPNVKRMLNLSGRSLCGELIFRTLMVLLTLAIAELVPALGLFISLIGALCSTSLALVFPPVIELIAKCENNKGPGPWIFIKNFIILVLALLGFSTGSYESLAEIIRHFGEEELRTYQKAIEAGEMGLEAGSAVTPSIPSPSPSPTKCSNKETFGTLSISPAIQHMEKNGMKIRDGAGGGDADDDDVESTVKKRHATSNLEAATHLFKGSVGAGLFAMGDCFKNGGLIGASLLLPVIAVICVHCERMLISGSVLAVERTPGATFFDYPETVEKCFEYGPQPLRRLSKIMKLIVETFLCVTQFGFCAIYFVFVTENLHQVLKQNGIDISMSMVMLLTLLPVMLPSLLTNLKYISPVSMLANFALIFGLVATLTIAFQDGPMPSPAERHYFTNGSQMSLFFGTALFSYEGIALVLPLRNSMRQPEQFSSRFGVLNVTMTCITALFLFTGFVSYTRWGEYVSGSITLNLNVEHVMSQVVKIIAALGVFFGYPIQFFVMMKIIWPPIKRSSNCIQQRPITMQVLLRFFMVMLTFGVALVVPKLGLFISLIGALCSTCLAFVIPVLIDFVVRAPVPKALSTWSYLKNIAILIVAVLGVATGTYQSIVEIVKEFNG